MSEDQNNTLLNTLDGNVNQIKAAIATIDNPDDLAALLEAEQNGNTRKTVVAAIEARAAALADPAGQEGNDPAEPESAPRTAADVEKDIEELESGGIDIRKAQRLHALRAELSGMKK